MTGLDTNVLLRFFSQDDPVQSPIAGRAIASLSKDEPGWIGLVAIVEFVWVMLSRKRASREAMAYAIRSLLETESLVIEQSAVVAEATTLFRTTRADFADCLIAASARAAGCGRVVTFDRVAARDAGMELLT